MEISFSPFLLSSTLQPIACLTSWWQHSHTPSTQKQGWYFCMRSLLKRTTVHKYGYTHKHIQKTFTLNQHMNLHVHAALLLCRHWVMLGYCLILHWLWLTGHKNTICKFLRVYCTNFLSASLSTEPEHRRSLQRCTAAPHHKLSVKKKRDSYCYNTGQYCYFYGSCQPDTLFIPPCHVS